MKVKAKCNIIYDGKMYHAGDEFESDKPLDNTEQITETNAIPENSSDTIRRTPGRKKGS